jgi:hypothetical protein
MKLGFWKLKVTAGAGSKRKWHIFCALTNLISQPNFYISPNWIASTLQMALAVGT